MKRSLFSLLLLALLLLPATPALARLVVGVSPAVTPGADERGVLDDCAQLLSDRTGEAFYFRSIADEEQLLDWLVRFRELDAALITPSAYASIPGGDLVKVAEWPGKGTRLFVVTYAGQAPARSQLLRSVAELAGTEPGRLLVASGAATPKDTPTFRPVVAIPEAQSKSPPPATRPAPQPPEPPTAQVTVARPAPAPVAVAPTETVEPAPAVAAQPASAVQPPPATQPVPVKIEQPAEQAPAPQAQPANTMAQPTKRTRLALLVAVILGTGILLKLALLLRHHRRRQTLKPTVSTRPAPVAPAPEPFASGQIPAMPPRTLERSSDSFGQSILPDLPSKWESMRLPPVLPPLPSGDDHAACEKLDKTTDDSKAC